MDEKVLHAAAETSARLKCNSENLFPRPSWSNVTLSFPAAPRRLINQMFSGVLGFTSQEPSVITKHHHLRASAGPLGPRHRLASGPTSGTEQHSVGIVMDEGLMAPSIERH